MVRELVNTGYDSSHEMQNVYRGDGILVGKYRVLFGYRIRGGYEDSPCYEFDICCGSKEEDYNKVFEKIKFIIENFEDPFDYIPTFTKVKPYYNDTEFIKWLENEINPI